VARLAVSAASAVAEISAVAEPAAVGKSREMKHQFQAFIDDLRNTHRDNLVSVTLYGSAAANDVVRDQSDYNLLIVLKEITPAELRNAHGAIREWHKLGHPVPVYFTASEIHDAVDVFPIEFYQMEKVRRVLYGADVLAEVRLSDSNLRHQVEYELRSKLMLLRRQYIPASASVDDLKSLMASSLSTFATLFRAVLLLFDVEPPVNKRETVALTAQHIKLDGKTFEKIFNIRENNFNHKLDDREANELFGDYLKQIEKVIDAVDALDNT
jgi:predicted nucleotidyltransferase